MKKILSLALVLLSVLPVIAGKTSKAWTFTLNDDGECVVERTLDTGKDGTAALKAVKSAINKQMFEERSTLNENAGESITYKLKKNTKTRYNPFAGNFNESMIFNMDIRYDNGQIKIRVYDLSLENKYEGYGKTVKNETFSGRIAEYEEAEETVKTAKGKEKKAAEGTIEEVNDSLNQCEDELNKILKAIEKVL